VLTASLLLTHHEPTRKGEDTVPKSDDYTQEQRDAFAFRLKIEQDRSPLSRDKIAAAAGKSAGMINHWTNGEHDPPGPWKVFALEKVLDLNPGDLSALLGYMPPEVTQAPPCTVELAIANDPALSPDERESLYGTYRLFARNGPS
jgi:hypothetical protein